MEAVMEPLVSVIIPTYCRPRLLLETLQSVAAQTYPNIEVLVMDDGTPGEEVLVLCKQFSNVSYHKLENSGGPSRPRNKGAELAKGTYLAFLDDDDLWLPNKLEQQVKILEANPQFGLVHTPCWVMDINGIVTKEIIGKTGSQEVKHGDVSQRMMGNWTLMTSSVLMRKSLYEIVGPFNETMPPTGEDTEFWNRCAFHSEFYYHAAPLVRYRRHDEGNSKKLKAAYFEVPWYLKKTLDDALENKLITKGTFKKLRNQLVRKQLKDLHYGRIKTLRRVFEFNPFWFLNFGNIKLFLKKWYNPN